MKALRRVALWAGLAVLSALAGPALAASADEKAFGEAALARARLVEPTKQFRLHPDDPLVIQISEDGTWDQLAINLHRVHAYCRNVAPADCETIRDDFLRRLAIKPLPPAADRLRVIVRDAAYVEAAREALQAKGDEIMARPIGGDLHALLAFDSPETISIALQGHLQELGITEAAAWPAALAQTLETLPLVPLGSITKRQGVALQHSEYLATLIADLDEWKGLAVQGGEDLFVTVVSDTFVYIGFHADGPDLDAFAQAVRSDCAAALRCISPHVYRFREGHWVIAG